MQLFQTISRKSLSIWLSLLCMLSLWSSFSLSASAEDDTIPSPIAWQQSEGSGAEEQRLAYLPEVDNWCDYPWNRGTETGNTVGQAGCSLLSIVNAVYYRTGSFLHPAKLAQFALDNGYRIPGVDGAAMGFFPAVAQAAEVVDKKDGKLDAEVEQGGKNFSGGQKQRLTIARALVKQPEILIMDDSSSALDYATDAKLRQAIHNMPNRPTVFIVSQRAASIMYADKIIVLDDGTVAGTGTHEELLKDCSVYQEIYYSQFKRTEGGH